jgi:anti-sigma regulatory factor (Ser/Thr protein kinase)
MCPPGYFEQRPTRVGSAGSEDVSARFLGAGAQLTFSLPAQWASPSLARERIERWLRIHGWPASSREDIVFVLSEAVTNSVEHGYLVAHNVLNHPGTIDVHSQIRTAPSGQQHVQLTIRDHGRWRPYPTTERINRSRGIPIMRATMDHVTIHGTDQGTTVILHSRPRPPKPHHPM